MGFIKKGGKFLKVGGSFATGPGCCCTSIEYDLCSGFSVARDMIEADGDFWIVSDAAAIRGGNRNFSVGGWVKADINQTFVIIGKDCDAGGREYLLEHRGGTGWQFLIYDGSNTTDIGNVSQGSLTVGEWFFVVGVHDDSANQVKISVNAAAFSNGSISGTPGTGTGDMHIGSGCGGSGSSGENISDGATCGLFFYTKALSISEIEDLYANCGTLYNDLSGSQTTSLSAYWNGDEASGNIIDDHSTHDGTAQGSPEDRTGVCEPTIFVDPTLISSPAPQTVKISPRGCYDLVAASATAIDTSVDSEHASCAACEA